MTDHRAKPFSRALCALVALFAASGCDPAEHVFGTVELPPGADVGAVVVQGYEVGGIDDAGLPRADADLRYAFLLNEEELRGLEVTDGVASFHYGKMGYGQEAEFIAWIWQQPEPPTVWVTHDMRPQAGDHLLTGGGVFDTGSDPRGPGLEFGPGADLDASIGPKTVLEVFLRVRTEGEPPADETPVTYTVLDASCASSCAPLAMAERTYGETVFLVLDMPAIPARVEASIVMDGRTLTATQDVSYQVGGATVGGYARVRLETRAD